MQKGMGTIQIPDRTFFSLTPCFSAVEKHDRSVKPFQRFCNAASDRAEEAVKTAGFAPECLVTALKHGVNEKC
jgi:hypothetical protein